MPSDLTTPTLSLAQLRSEPDPSDTGALCPYGCGLMSTPEAMAQHLINEHKHSYGAAQVGASRAGFGIVGMELGLLDDQAAADDATAGAERWDGLG